MPSPDGERLAFKTAGHLEIVDARTGVVERRVAWSPGVQGVGVQGVRWTGGGRFVAWMEGTPLGSNDWTGHLIRAVRVADGALLWMALLDEPDGVSPWPRAREGSTPAPPRPASPEPMAEGAFGASGLVAEFFAGGP